MPAMTDMKNPEAQHDTKPNEFYDRVDAFIHAANQQCSQDDKGKVSASFLFAAARFNSWVSASGFENSELMQANRQELVQYFVQQYQSMLEDNLDEFITNFSSYQKGQ
jgi:hypothetical protein